ncbi:MAG TPA: leucine--tRNA ligase [Bacteroidetes bacterium]|nr:leucine--tRNA ligase [Bacteroidota bacterium]
MEYKPREIEKKWKGWWVENQVYKVSNPDSDRDSKPKFYVLDMFPYPSGSGLHVGHPLGYIASDIYARFKRMKGFNVLHPMGYDAFGLPAEQYAIQTGVHPAKSTADNIARYRAQLDNLGFSFDWSREVQTSDPKYYKWTQWIFLQLFNHWYDQKADKARPIADLVSIFEKEGNTNVQAAHSQDENFTTEEWKAMDAKAQSDVLMNYRLAYRKTTYVWWCEELGTVLANDEVKDGFSERGGHPVERKPMLQWSLRITAYAQRLLDGLQTVDFSEAMKKMQGNWIGRSEGALMRFNLAPDSLPPAPSKGGGDGTQPPSVGRGAELPPTEGGCVPSPSPLGRVGEGLSVFTTRPDTIFGATFMVLAPEHDLVKEITTPGQADEIKKYLAYVNTRSERDRMSETKEVSGAFTGAYALNPFNGAKIPIWIAEYVLKDYGTGAIMAVPADDERDRRFAEKFGLEIIEIIDKSMYPGASIEDKKGKMINSDFLNGMEVKDAIEAVLQKIEEMGIGKRQVNFRLRDAIYSRQRYWGEPFPIVYDEQGVAHALPENELPLELPELDDFRPATGAKAPLARATDWVNLPNGWKRETDTMPGFAGSSWYFLRYMDAHNEEEFASQKALNYWQDVDLYVGGTEHAVGHLMYSRFWHKFLYDKGLVPTSEPYKKLLNQGMIQGVVESMYLLKEKKDGYSKFVCAKMAKKIGITDYVNIPVLVDYVVNYGSPDSYLNIDAIKKFMDWRPEYKDAIFECSKGVFHKGEFTPKGDATDSHLFTFSEVGKMSKSKYNVINPDDVVEQYGADTFRMYEMFLGPIEQAKPWDTKGINGVAGFLRKMWALFFDKNGNFNVSDAAPTKEELKTLHTCIKKVQDDIERFSFNTCVSGFMICVNDLRSKNCNKRAILEPLVKLVAPFAPHIAEELWHRLGHETTVCLADYPVFEESHLVEDSVTYPVCINGKKRDSLTCPANASKEDLEKMALELESTQKWIDGKTVRKVIVVPGRMINVVVG